MIFVLLAYFFFCFTEEPPDQKSSDAKRPLADAASAADSQMNQVPLTKRVKTENV